MAASEQPVRQRARSTPPDMAQIIADMFAGPPPGIEFNPDAAWDERKRVYEMSDLIVDSLSITAFAEGASNRDWTCAVAAAVFRFAAPGDDNAAGAK